MPRQSRIDFPGVLHYRFAVPTTRHLRHLRHLWHIMVRGIEGRFIFGSVSDKQFFLERLGETLTETETDGRKLEKEKKLRLFENP